MSFENSDIIINNVILPDNIDDIALGDEFELKFELIRFATGYNDKNNQLVPILLEVKIEFKDKKIIELKYNDEIPTGKRIIRMSENIKKVNYEFDIIGKLYELKYLGIQKKLKFETVTKHRVNQETLDNIIKKRLEIKK